MRKFQLTFDAEDFISTNSIWVLNWILERLKKYDLQAWFFITGHMAERLENFPAVVDLLGEHQIGYHSSSHSVHPTIFEFTDVEDYEQAYRVSLERETAHISPLTGEIDGKGGILALRTLFHRKDITSFRAPGHCWTPPHLEALKALGITSDFSTNISSTPVTFKSITFNPYPAIGHWNGKLLEYKALLHSLLRNQLTIITFHPSLFVNSTEWDSIYRVYNPKLLLPPNARNHSESEHLLHNFDLFIKRIAELQMTHAIETKPNLEKPRKALSITKIGIENCYQRSMRWAIKHDYKPKFLFNHFFSFFFKRSHETC